MIERLFLALWPNDDVRSQLETASLGIALQGGRRVLARNLHVTLIFLGSCNRERRACIENVLSSLHAVPFEFTLTTVESKRGIVWATTEAVPDTLLDLVSSTQAALSVCQYAPEPRPFRPHVTLARDVKRGPRRQPIFPIQWQARTICLVSSQLAAQGPEYTVIREWSFA